MIASTLAVSSLHVTPALAAESYKVKSGKLVNAKTNKVVKGYKLHKNILYKDGKRTTGNVVYKNVLYSNGKKATGTKLYKKVLYVAGKKPTGYKTYKSVLYYKGTTFTGTRGNKYYKAGKTYTGFRTISAQKVYYKSGVRYTGVYKNNFYLDGLPNAGYTVHKDILYKDTQVATGLLYYGDRLYVNGKLGNGTFDYNGKMTLFINGVLQKDVTTGGDSGTNPGSESPPPGTTTPEGGTNTGGGTNAGGNPTSGGSIIIIGEMPNSGGSTTPGGGTNSGGDTKPGSDTNTGGGKAPGSDTNTGGDTTPGDTSNGGEKVPTGDTNTEDGKKPSEGGTITDTVTVINKTEVYKEVSAANIADIQAIVNAYNKLSAADKKKVTYPINDVAQLLTVYKINQSKISTVTAQSLDEARELISLYNDLTAANKQLVQLDIKGLEAAIAQYLESLQTSAEELNSKPTFNEITLSNYEQAATILAAYEQLSKAEQAKVTYPIATLKLLLDVYKLNSTPMPLVDASTISSAKALVALYESLGSYQSKVTFDITALKKAIEQYDNPTLLSIDKINKQTVIYEVTAANIDTAREIINSFGQLSQTD